MNRVGDFLIALGLATLLVYAMISATVIIEGLLK